MGKKRLDILLRRLLEGPATTRELADRTGVSSRTIARDIKLLTTAGVPVYTQPGRGGGLVIAPAGDADRLFLQRTIARHSTAGTDEDLLRTLVAHFRGTCGPGMREVESAVLDALRSAVLQQSCVHLNYLAMNGRVRRGDVYPKRVFIRRGQWCFSAVPAHGGPEQLLIVSRVCSVKPGVVPAREAQDRSAAAQVEFLFPGSMALQLLSTFGEEPLYETDTGDILVRPATFFDIWHIGFYLSKRVPIVPIGPEGLVKDALKKALAAYNRGMPHYRCPARMRSSSFETI